MKKREQLSRALDRLDEALDTYNTTPNSIIRDGVFQRFEFCTELAWKAAREYLLDQGHVEINSPKSTLRQAYADGMVTDQAGWLKLLDDRNLTSHIYNDATASEIFQRIQNTHRALLQELSRYLNGETL